jgi:DNA mismatch endonuclease, patch repair protein
MYRQPSWNSVPNKSPTNKSQPTTFGGLSRSELMSRIRSRNNATTEIRLLKMLRRAGLSGWRRHIFAPGTPDFCWIRERLVVFVHGCFWHGHNCGRNLESRSNAMEWRVKIARNQRRDLRSARSLRQLGWSVVTLWECQLREAPERCIRRVARYLSTRRVSDRRRRKP